MSRLLPYLLSGVALALLTRCRDRDALPAPPVVWTTPTEVLGAEPDIIRPPWLVADGVMVITQDTETYYRSFVKLSREDGSVLGQWNPNNGYSVGNGNKHVHGSVMAYTSYDNRLVRIFDTNRMDVVHDIPLPGTATYISGLGSQVFALQAISAAASRVWQIDLNTYAARPLFTTADTDTSFFGFVTLPIPYVSNQLDTCLLMLTRPPGRSSLNRFALINYSLAHPEQTDTLWLPRYFDTDNPPVFTVYDQGMVVCSDLENDQLVGIDIDQKQIIWTRKTNSRNGSDWPVAGDGKFFVATSSFLCLDITTGETIWENKEGDYGIRWGSIADLTYSPPVIFLGTIALRSLTGTPLWDALDEYNVSKLPFYGRGTVDEHHQQIYYSGKHGIYAIRHPR